MVGSGCSGLGVVGGRAGDDRDNLGLTLAIAHDVLLLDLGRKRERHLLDLAQNAHVYAVFATLVALGGVALALSWGKGQSGVELADAVGLAGLLRRALGDLKADDLNFHDSFPFGDTRKAMPLL